LGGIFGKIVDEKGSTSADGGKRGRKKVNSCDSEGAINRCRTGLARNYGTTKTTRAHRFLPSRGRRRYLPQKNSGIKRETKRRAVTYK